MCAQIRGERYNVGHERSKCRKMNYSGEPVLSPHLSAFARRYTCDGNTHVRRPLTEEVGGAKNEIAVPALFVQCPLWCLHVIHGYTTTSRCRFRTTGSNEGARRQGYVDQRSRDLNVSVQNLPVACGVYQVGPRSNYNADVAPHNVLLLCV